MRKLRAGIIGSGLIAGKKHIPAFLRQKNNVDLVAVCDLSLQAAQKAATTFGIPKVYANYSQMLSQEKLDLVDICTPPQTHADLAVAAMERDCHVLIEKPMTLNIEDSDRIVEASNKFGVKVCVAHSDLFYWPFVKARKLVQNGEIGDFCGMRIFLSTPTDYITSKKEHWAHRLPGGVIGETGPHVVYMTLAFINPVCEVNVIGKKLLEYPWSRFDDYRIELIGEKAVSSITLSYTSNQWAARVEILGSKGILVLDLESLFLVKYRRPKLTPWSTGLSALSESFQIARSLFMNGLNYYTGSLTSTHDALMEGFVYSIVKGTPEPVTAAEGREAVRVINMITNKLEG
jgi:predicted dehydrogenase